MMTKEQRQEELSRLMKLAANVECTVLAGNPGGIHICTYCEGWWHDGEIQKHDIDCKRPLQGT
jgi:hypothetical protein